MGIGKAQILHNFAYSEDEVIPFHKEINWKEFVITSLEDFIGDVPEYVWV
jgi:hypothetical protein